MTLRYIFVLEREGRKGFDKVSQRIKSAQQKIVSLSQTQTIKKEKENPSPFLQITNPKLLITNRHSKIKAV